LFHITVVDVYGQDENDDGEEEASATRQGVESAVAFLSLAIDGGTLLVKRVELLFFLAKSLL